ncbi:beta strand repeat-containing protein [Gemmatimonas sp.]|uniref:beta strand repeat-containing protein n=1 Tax=Gemmatimonas sp. TaxID=1962908 RepID=UPI003F6EEFCA
MQLFSRNKTLSVLSLGALAALGACGDDVTVPVAPAAPVVISITPPSSSLNVGESVSFAVQISGGNPAPTLASCTSSNTAVATAAVNAGACRVTAVAAGNATVTAAASTGQSAAASVTVSAPAPAITALSVSPSAAQLAVGQSVTLVPTVQPAGRTVAYTYATSAATIATVANGVVTAVAPGVATITVTAAGSGTGFSNATIAQAVTITVSERTPGLSTLNVQPSTVALALGGTQQLTASAAGPRASAATITYGTSAPAIATVSATGVITAVSAGTAVVTVTAQSAESGAFAASSITGLVAVTVSPNAQVAIVNLTRGGSTIDISNVTDQIEANLAIQPNGQTVSEVNLWVCLPAETVAACAARTDGVPAARQSFTASGTQAATVQMYINTNEFTTPDFTSGADANTLYKNGLRTLVATLTTTPAAASTIASNSISQVNFNNPDGWTIRWTAPTNRANDVNNITWYGGPSTPDALTPSATSGTGSFVVVPVIYTPNRTVVQASLDFPNATCGAAITDRTRPFAGTYGSGVTRDTLAVSFNCTGATGTAGTAPQVTGGVDNNNNGYAGVTSTPAVARSIFDDFTNIANSTTGGYRQSLAYRPNNLYLPHDYLAPTITAFDVRGGTDGTVTYQDSAWVNAAYFLAGANATTTTSAANLRYRINDANVGLTSSNGLEIGAGAAQRNTQFNVCAQAGIPASIATAAAAINCTTPAATGGITATIGSMTLAESATNFTNTAYFAQAIETDRLGNRARSVVYTTSVSTRTAGVNTGATGPAVFGVDLTGPQVATIQNTGTGSIANFARTDVDSIYSAVGNTYGTTNNTNAVFAIRFTDNRSGFPICVEATAATAGQGTCRNGTAGTNVRAGTFGIQRRSVPTLATVTNDAVNQAIVATSNASTVATNRYLDVIDAPVSGLDNAFREFTINIFGAANRVASTVTLTGGVPAATVAGYYTFSGSLTDRAGNTTTLPARSVAIDNADPSITGISVAPVLTGGTTVAFGPTGTDDLEAISGDLALRYPQLQYNDAIGAAVGTLPTTIRFRRVPHYSTSAPLGLWHNPFAAVTDNKLTTPVGPGTSLASNGLTVPVPFIQQIATVTAGAAPLTQTQLFGLFPGVADPRPNQVTAWLYDIRATSPITTFGNGRSAGVSQAITGAQIQTPATILTTKDWTTAVGGAGIQNWQISTVAGVSEFRAQTPTSITNPPFTSVYIVRQVGTTEWEYIGTATYAGPLDQGGNRFWRYTLSSSSFDQGNGVTMAALTSGDNIKAIGVDAAGNGLSTATSTFGLPLAIPTSSTFGPFAVAAQNQGGAVQNIALSITGGASAGANVVYSCSSNNALVTAVIDGVNPAQCNIDDAGIAGAATQVTITFTVTGSGAGFSTTSRTSTTIITRNP